MPEFRSAGLVCGYSYEDSPINVPDGTPPRPPTIVEFEPSARPGSRAPHRWLADGTSLYDHFGREFTLLTDGRRRGEAAAFAEAAARRAVPVTALALDDERLPALYDADFTLVRPDQTVAWRSNALPTEIDAILDTVRGAETADLTRAAPA
jgi:hypothetical protein